MISSILALGLFVCFVLSPVLFMTAITVADRTQRRRQTRAQLPAVDTRRGPAFRESAAPAAV